MKRSIFLTLIPLLFASCGYPDIDNVPDFTNVDLNSEEIDDYCNNVYTLKTNIDKCIIDYKTKN